MFDSGVLTALDGVPFVLPVDGKTLSPALYSAISFDPATATTQTIAFDYGLGFGTPVAITTKENTQFTSIGVKKVSILVTGADCDFRFVTAAEIGGV